MVNLYFVTGSVWKLLDTPSYNNKVCYETSAACKVLVHLPA